MALTNARPTNGDCECCVESIDVVLYGPFNGMMMCESCRDKQLEAVKVSNIVITESRKVDDTTVLSKDIWNAGTLAFHELEAAIQNNPEIPDDQKRYKLAEEASLRIQKFNQIIFEAKAEVVAWLKNTHDLVATLRTDQRAKLKQYDLNYNPSAPSKKVKSTSSGPSKRSFDKAALYAASKKYGVPAAQVQSIIVSKGMSVEAAARYMAELLGLPTNK